MRPRRVARAGGEGGTAFQRYLRSLQVADVLPPEEERRLALLYRDNTDADAAARLVRGNLRLVVKIAEEYGRSEDQLMDFSSRRGTSASCTRSRSSIPSAA